MPNYSAFSEPFSPRCKFACKIEIQKDKVLLKKKGKPSYTYRDFDMVTRKSDKLSSQIYKCFS